MFFSRRLSLVMLASLLLAAGAALAPSQAAADGPTGRVGSIYTVTLYYATDGQWVGYNTYFATYYADGEFDDGGSEFGYQTLVGLGYTYPETIKVDYGFWRPTDNG